MLLDLDIKTEGDRILVITESSWENYKLLLDSESSYLISYLDNEITIVAPGRNHERIAETIRILIQAYCRKYLLPYYALGSKDIKRKFVVGKQPDASYCFDVEKDIPDLAIEVNYSSGSINDLEKYRRLEVSEVLLWQTDRLHFFGLERGKNNDSEAHYRDRAMSLNLPKLDVNFLQPFIARGLTEDNLAIETDFYRDLL